MLNEYSKNYARAVYGIFSKSLTKAKELGMVNENRTQRVGAISKEKVIVEYWEKEEFEKVIETFNLADCLEHLYFVMIWLYFMTGLRVNEATALVWDRDIDLDQGTLSVKHSLRLKSKNDWSFGPTKTEAGKRTISLDDDTIEILKDWKQRQEQNINSELVLSYDGKPMIKSTINRVVKRHAKLAGVKEIQPKGLRHSHASLLINEHNMNVLIIKERLGHEDVETTLGTYSHLYQRSDNQVAKALSGTVKIDTAKKSLTNFNGNQHFKR